MKKLTALWMMIVMFGTLSVSAMSLNKMRRNVRFLTDRMAYELQLSSEQYNDVYEVNFDFMYQVDPIMKAVARGDEYALNEYYNFLDIRNDDLRWILSSYQYSRFMQISYFYRPVYTYRRSWNLGIFKVYTNHNFFYFDVPIGYRTYCGGHYRTHFGNRSFYEIHHRRYRGFEVFKGDFRIARGRDLGHHPVPRMDNRRGRDDVYRIGRTDNRRPKVNSRRYDDNRRGNNNFDNSRERVRAGNSNRNGVDMRYSSEDRKMHYNNNSRKERSTRVENRSEVRSGSVSTRSENTSSRHDNNVGGASRHR
ncbi:MAG: hypothetical protein ACTTJK_03345 [Phocaeicola sp.]|uniref:hypothetical protein n=1 Tax=Phocaeicola sp. TaxID=2773926 RepID=UPI003F9FD96C